MLLLIYLQLCSALHRCLTIQFVNRYLGVHEYMLLQSAVSRFVELFDRLLALSF